MRYLIIPTPRGEYRSASGERCDVRATSATAVLSGPRPPIEAATEAAAAAQAELTLVPPPAAPVPASINNDQLRLALPRLGISIASVDAALAAITDEAKRGDYETMWEYRQTFRRDDSRLIEMATSLGLNSDQLDALFRLAATL